MRQQQSDVTIHTEPRLLRILAISGSLRARSSNTVLLRAATALAPKHVIISVYAGLADLPPFNPDLDNDDPPPAVRDFRLQLQDADGVLISSPEYAHGVPGVLKNALDWVVGSGEFVGKPVALLGASARATYARASLMETLGVMMGQIIAEASLTVPLTTNNLTEADMVADPEASRVLQAAIVALADAIELRRNVA